MSMPGEDTGESSAGDAFRTSHIKRVFQNDDPDSGVWIDIERIDEFQRSTEVAADGQASHWVFDWSSFDPGSTSKKRIADPSDDSNYIEVPVRDSYTVRSDIDGQVSTYHFVNDETNGARVTHSRRIYHHDIKDGYLQDGLPPTNPDDYLNSLGDQDIGQYVDVEIIDYNWTRQPRLRDMHGQRIRTFSGLLKAIHNYSQRKRWISWKEDRLLREPLLDNDEADSNFMPIQNPDAGPQIDPPWRLDPIQNIVNVNWGGLAVIFGPEAEDAPDQKKQDQTA